MNPGAREPFFSWGGGGGGEGETIFSWGGGGGDKKFGGELPPPPPPRLLRPLHESIRPGAGPPRLGLGLALRP